ncbi:hypothetical protein DLM46_11700 [Paraburkholderia lacunae]|uniref:Uncharacterized protein n=1 Tax=Paraburkholderia lacunae TaxID=2211104 RepID=A0A370NBJ0_9BURK|nr:hypothetical protein DLM46_11700 [Paraburkholderia lacunae]
MTLLVAWRTRFRTWLVRGARLRRIAIAFIAVGAAAGSVLAASQFGNAPGGQADPRTTLDTMPVCGRLAALARSARMAGVFALSRSVASQRRGKDGTSAGSP